MATLEEIEQRRLARRQAAEQAAREQEARDLEAVDAIEEERGESLLTMTANGYRAGSPVRIAFRAPTAAEYKRYCDMIGRSATAKYPAVDRLKAQTLLAEACWLYPAKDSDARGTMLEAFPGVLVSLAIEAAKAAECRAEDEGKG